MALGLETIQQNFFATSHGKGPVDGIGGTIKRDYVETDQESPGS